MAGRMVKKRACRCCGARNTKAVCRVCRWRLPAWLDQLVIEAIANRFTTVEEVAAVEMAVACVEDDHEIYRRLDSLTDVSQTHQPRKQQ